jgi:probable F420-dependent oxidoreductase
VSRSIYPVRIGIKLAQDAPIDAFRRVWHVADDAGFDHCWAFDHLANVGPTGGDTLVFEGWTLLAAMAEATKRTRIGLLVSGLVYRHPALLAKQAVTVDHLSGGRLEFGIGAGWAPVEQRMYGIDTLGRPAGRLAEGLQVMKRLWTQERSHFDGRFFQLRDAVGIPKPVQQPHPPIWVGAGGAQMLRVAARHADVWNPAGDGLEAAVAAGRQLRMNCEEIHRDPAEIRWSTQLSFDGSNPTAMLAELRRWHQSGFTELVIYCSGRDPIQAAEITAAEVLPRARQLG